MGAPEDNAKKAWEREILDQFIEKCDDIPRARIKASESPDFILSSGRKFTIGVEVTQLLSDQNASGRYLSREAIDSSIKKKDEKIALYQKKKMDRYWLLIAVGGEARDLDLHQNVASWQFESGFNRIFIFQMHTRKLIEISC
jgi:hypothetical protein